MTLVKSERSNSPLVSIIVVTYNSCKSVIETLESAKYQTYNNIELIITDDGSNDETLAICQQWLNENRGRFVKTELVTVEKNTGIPANCNRGVRASTGEWLKLIAGDDLLVEDCIETNLQHAMNGGHLFVISDMIYFNSEVDVIEGYGSKKEITNFLSKQTAHEKLRSYRRNSVFPNSPTCFYHRSVYDKNGGCDEEFVLLDDNPFIINTLMNDIDISFLSKKTVKYRLSSTSVTGKGGDTIQKDIRKYYQKYIKEQLKKGSAKDQMFNSMIMFEVFLKSRGFAGNLLFKVYYRLTSKIREKS